ncbi:MAG: molecular chaperone HscC [Planctomycetia bacterium]|nr:molecular chaperone HscC [Planctomycetia bacterium]
MSVIIGIDLGTTNSVVAAMTDQGPKLIPNALGETLTPSVVGIDEHDKLLVGLAARELQVVAPERCASIFKRHMGTDRSVKICGRKFSPEELSSLVLQSLKEDAAAFLQLPIERAVITVPAYFNEHQRKATINAGRIAGLKVERIFNEPTAAAVAYGFHEMKDDKTIVVLDLGGGTFDVSVVELFEGVLEVRASSGENFLGGEDFTRVMAAKILQQQGLVFERCEHESSKLVSRLLQQCERAKCRLSREETASVRLPNREGEFPAAAAAETKSADATNAEVTITREELLRWTEHLIARVEMPIRRALGDAKLAPEKIDEVVLVGGATRMPRFIQRVGEIFGKPPHCRLNPDEVVAIGAAVQSGLMSHDAGVDDLVVTDVSPFSLGTEIAREFGVEVRDGYFMPVIHRNTTIPVSRVRRVSTLHPNQTHVTVKIYQGEARRCEDNLLLGEFEVRNIPPGPAGQEIDLRFTYDLNGVIEVEATIVKSGKKYSHVVTRHAQGMSPEQIAKAVAAMKTIKVHPREDSVNRFLLQRAERLYQELPAPDRDRMDRVLHQFESALELGDPRQIEEQRAEVRSFLALFDRGDDYEGAPDAEP